MSDTNKELQRINSHLPKRIANNITKTEVDTSGELLADHAIKSKWIPKEKRRQIYNMKEAGKFRKSEEVINEKAAKEADEYHSREVDKAIKSGKLPDPMKDPFYRERMKRVASGNIKKADPFTRREILAARERLKR